MKKILSVFLLLVLSLNIYLFRPKQAEAVVVAEVLIPAITSILICAGITMQNSDSVRRSANAFWGQASQSIRDAISDAYTTYQTSGLLGVTNDVWNAIRAYVTGNYSVGSGTAYVPFYSSVGYQEGVDYLAIAGFMISGYDHSSPHESIPSLTKDYFRIVSPNGDYIYTSHTSSQYQTYSDGYYTPHLCYDALQGGRVIIHYKCVSDGSYISGSSIIATGIGVSGEVSEDLPVEYVGSTHIVDTEWDIAVEGVREIVPADSVDGAVGLTVEDILSQSQSGSGTGEYSGVLSGISSIVSAISSAVSNTWTAVSSIATSIATFFDFSGEIDFQPLRVVGTTFTTKFPFSLPWDLKNSFVSLSSSGFNPVIGQVIHTGGVIGDIDFHVDLSMWQSVVDVVRKLELLIFDIGLIFYTRRLLGGAS